MTENNQNTMKVSHYFQECMLRKYIMHGIAETNHELKSGPQNLISIIKQSYFFIVYYCL